MSKTRDVEGEIAGLLERAQQSRQEHDGLDMAAEAETALASVARLGQQALEQGQRDSQRAHGKITDAQERFKAGVVASGLTLDEIVEVEGTERAAPISKLKAPNKYTVVMESTAQRQRQERAATRGEP